MEMLSEELVGLLQELEPDVEHEVREEIAGLISDAILKEWPTARVVIYGSHVLRLYMPDGDIDIVVRPPAGRIFADCDEKMAFLQEIAPVLLAADVTEKIKFVESPRVPLLDFKTVIGSIPIDLSIDNELGGLDTLRMTQRYLENIPVIRSLFVPLKMYIKRTGHGSPAEGGIGSIVLLCMAVSFIQMRKVIRARKINPMRNRSMLFLDMLLLYTLHFNYDKVGISIRNGGSYFPIANKLNDPNCQYKGWGRGYMCRIRLNLENPVHPDTNMAASTHRMMDIRLSLSHLYQTILSRLSLQSSQLKWRENEEDGDKEARNRPAVPAVTSFLQGLISITTESLEFRERLRRTDVLQLRKKRSGSQIILVS